MIPTLATLIALDPAALEARLAETNTLRAQRIFEDAPTIPASAYTKATTGEVVSGVVSRSGKAPVTWAVGIIDVGIDDLWAALNDETHHVGITPLSYAAVLRGSPCADDRYAMMVLPVPVLDDRWLIKTSSGKIARAANRDKWLAEPARPAEVHKGEA